MVFIAAFKSFVSFSIRLSRVVDLPYHSKDQDVVSGFCVFSDISKKISNNTELFFNFILFSFLLVKYYQHKFI